MMNSRQLATFSCAATLLLGLAACGGGSGSGGTTPAAAPTSGSYAWVLKAQGPTSALSYALSLVHPSLPGVEWVIEYGSSVVTDSRPIASGSVDATARTASG